MRYIAILMLFAAPLALAETFEFPDQPQTNDWDNQNPCDFGYMGPELCFEPGGGGGGGDTPTTGAPRIDIYGRTECEQSDCELTSQAADAGEQHLLEEANCMVGDSYSPDSCALEVNTHVINRVTVQIYLDRSDRGLQNCLRKTYEFNYVVTKKTSRKITISWGIESQTTNFNCN